MSADGGQDIRDMATLQARVSDVLAQVGRQDAEIVKLKGFVSALHGRVKSLEMYGCDLTLEDVPNETPVDQGMPESARLVMVERLRRGTQEGLAANKTDRNREGNTYRQDRQRLTDVE